jgi:hypothetical protein
MVRYADDTTLIVSEPQPEDLKIEAESVLHDTFRWFTNNQLIINPSKTQLLLLGNKTKTDEWNNFAITVGDKVVYPSESLTLLGVTLDCKLSYEQHVSKKLKKAGYSLKLARNVNNITSTSQRQLLMSSYVLPHLIYCCSLFISLKQSQIKRVNHFFKVARRSLQLDASSTVPFEELCMRRGLSLLHHAFHTNVPLLFSANIQTSNSSYNMRSATRLILPTHSTAIMANSIIVKTAKVWNKLPPAMEKYKSDPKSHSFKTALVSVAGTCTAI